MEVLRENSEGGNDARNNHVNKNYLYLLEW